MYFNHKIKKDISRNAQRVRRLVVDEWKKLFKDYDAVILPVGSGPAKHLDGSKDILTKDTEISRRTSYK